MPKAKATAGERFCLRYLRKGTRLKDIREGSQFELSRAAAAWIDRLLARERAKVAEDVLVAFEKSPGVAGSVYQAIAAMVRAKYGKGKG